MPIDLSKFSGTLPYDSQMYGIYQPLLGWRSSQQTGRLHRGVSFVKQRYLRSLGQNFTGSYTIHNAISDAANFEVSPAKLTSDVQPPDVPGVESILTRHVIQTVLASGGGVAEWKKFTSPDFLTKALGDIHNDIKMEFLKTVQSREQNVVRANAVGGLDNQAILAQILHRESVSAGILAQLNHTQTAEQLKYLFSPTINAVPNIAGIFAIVDPAQSQIARAALSPIGIVHLFREYFFEFATFLGTPVQHIWLSPGGAVELVEINTRKTMVERTIEQSFESIQKTEKSTSAQDELSDAVKQENSSDTKLGVSATSNTNYTVGFVSGSASITGSFNLDQQQKQAREQTHKSTRQQTEKLSTEIRQSYKSTFKTLTETTDTTSKRYTLQNTTQVLVNYELRRKMRQVGVQLQDYGTRLCWQAYVDSPGDTLGLPLFVHMADLPELQSIKQPDQTPIPDPFARGQAVTFPLHWGMPDVYIHHFVRGTGDIILTPPTGFIFDHAEVTIEQGPAWGIQAWPSGTSDSQIDIFGSADDDNEGPPIHIDARGGGFIQDIDTGDGTTEPVVTKVFVGIVIAPGGIKDDTSYDWTVQFTPVYRPSKALLKRINDLNAKNLDKFTEEKRQAFQDAIFKSVRERVKLASNIQPRGFSDLREEERIVIYRKLVQQLLNVAGIKNEDPHVRHVFSEVVESMFDMDNLLYFVAPDWWMPRQQVTSTDTVGGLGLTNTKDQLAFNQGNADNFREAAVVSWGGPRASRPDNYYITEDSAPAKLGSSLGWLLQLDADNFRNAFLNAPWVKTVIPIQEGHEWSALDWMSSSAIEGSDGLNDLYQETVAGEKAAMILAMQTYTAWPDPSLGPRYVSLNPGQFTILDAIRYLIVVIQRKQAAARTKIKDAGDPTLSYLPTDKVYEHGFDPLQGGFVAQAKNPFEIFDQWIEVLPTDQIVPVEVTYDPKTGMQI